MPEGSGIGQFADHFNGKRYFNPDGQRARGLFDVLRWKLTSRAKPSPAVADVQPSKPPARTGKNELRTTLVNHSTVLLQTAQFNLITDPIWSERAGPVSWAGPRRKRVPGIRRGDLPVIDIVLLSHNHYDHLDLPTLRWLGERDAPVCVAPKGLTRLLRGIKLRAVHELDWGGQIAIAALTIHSVPAVHFSARGLFDRDRTLWCGYVLETEGRSVYFAGDTAFGTHFEKIRSRFGRPRLALLPIGAYQPRWFMQDVHMDPADALRAQQILDAEASIAIHHGTFQLGDEGIDTPAGQLLALSPPASFRILRNGETLLLSGS